ncbi:MAG: hypothetical protein P8Y26_16640 [Gemmatimonadales bacterium]
MSGTKERVLLIRFDNMSPADANRAAAELRKQLRSSMGSQVSIDRVKENEETQDFGSTLAVVLGTPFALALAKGVRDYIAKRGCRIVLETPEGRLIATGDAAANIDVASTAAALGDPEGWTANR